MKLVTGSLKVSGLRLDGRERPLGSDARKPRLSWRIDSRERDVHQQAFRIVVASSAELLGSAPDIWDSGRITSAECVGVVYLGTHLQPTTRYWWAVEVWDRLGRASGLSEPSWWETGLMGKGWEAGWLAVESPIQTGDRLHGFHWVQCPESQGELTARTAIVVPEGAHEVHLVWACNGALVQAVEVDGSEQALDGERWLDLPLDIDSGRRELLVRLRSPSGLVDELFTAEFAAFVRVRWLDGRVVRLEPPHTEWVLETPSGATPGARSNSLELALPPGPAMQLRRHFEVPAEVRSARLYATALGTYLARVNGAPVDESRLAPEVDQYSRRVSYQTYDVTHLIQCGDNALAFTVADGWYASHDGRFAWGPPPRRLLARLELRLADGTNMTVVTDEQWRIAESPVRVSQFKGGETVDHRLTQFGWDEAGFNDSAWDRTTLVEPPDAEIVAQRRPAIRRQETIAPLTITQPEPGVHVVDFGQEFAGVCRLRVEAPRGTRVELRYAEMLDGSGRIDDRSMGNPGASPRPPDVFILAGEPDPEEFETSFTYRGFRYAELRGLPDSLAPEDLTGIALYSDLPRTGTFSSDDDRLDRLALAVDWTLKSNALAVFTDCPSREQRGWLADAAIFWDTSAYLRDVGAFTSQYLDAIADDQHPDGSFPVIAPQPIAVHASQQGMGTSPAWASAGVILPWSAWWRYGDDEVLERMWEPMDRFLRFVEANNPEHLWLNKRGWVNRRGFDFGDWLAPDDANVIYDPEAEPRTDTRLIATAYWAWSCRMMAEMSAALGQQGDSERYRALGDRVRSAFIESFVAADGRIGTGSQTSLVLALKFELVPAHLVAAVANRLVEDIRNHGTALTTGIVGTQFILDVLAEHGHEDVAYALLLRREYPSWGHMLEEGGTTFWEEWSGDMAFRDGRMPMSRNHPAFAAVGAFLFRRVAGIDGTSPGYRSLRIRPLVSGPVTGARATFHSVYGQVGVDWTRKDETLTVDIEVPPNSSAEIQLPLGPERNIMESGMPVAFSVSPDDDGIADFRIGSGRYRFLVK